MGGKKCEQIKMSISDSHKKVVARRQREARGWLTNCKEGRKGLRRFTTYVDEGPVGSRITPRHFSGITSETVAVNQVSY